MANYLQAWYFLIDNEKLSEYQDFDNFNKNIGDGLSYFSVQSRHGWSAHVLLQLLQASGQEGKLKFLTEARDIDAPYILITSDSFENIISEVNKLVLWCKQNIEQIGIVLDYVGEFGIITGYKDELNKIQEAIDSTLNLLDDARKIDNEGDGFEWLFAYLRTIVKMIHQAEKKQQSIVCVSHIC